jgi:glycosyltransferase involved in cell wall biosynthesis
VPGCRDSIIPNETGILIPPKDPLTLAKELCGLLANRSKCEEMGYMGRALAENFYDLREVVDKHIKIYENLLNYKRL